MNRGLESSFSRNTVLELFSTLVAKQRLSLVTWKTLYENLIGCADINYFQDTHRWQQTKLVLE